MRLIRFCYLRLWQHAIALPGTLLVAGLIACLAPSSHAAAPPPEKRGPTVLRDIPYPDAVMGERRRSLDLYLPADEGRKPPLLIFVHGGFWLMTDDDYRIGPAVAEALVPDRKSTRLNPSHVSESR